MISAGSEVLEAWCRAYSRRHCAAVTERAWLLECPVNRAQSDTIAAWLRWHIVGADVDFTAEELPWYDLLELARVEVLAMKELPGVRCNLEGQLTWITPDLTARDLHRIFRLALLVEDLSTLGENRRLFARASGGRFFLRKKLLALLRSIFGSESVLRRKYDLMPFIVVLRPVLHDGVAFAEAAGPLVKLLVRRIKSPVQNRKYFQWDDHGANDGAKSVEFRKDLRVSEKVLIPSLTEAPSLAVPYRIFSRRWDEISTASQLRKMVQYTPSVETSPQHSRMRLKHHAQRLLRRLERFDTHRWQFDCEDGELDSRRLTRIVTSGCDPLVFRKESKPTLPGVAVTLLVDQSRSMQRARQRVIVAAIDVLVRVLEATGIKTEVLGYTTMFSGGENPVRQCWKACGSPEAPGRLNGTRHIIYKASDCSWAVSRRNFDMLLRSDFGRENIDGEAISWALGRLLLIRRPKRFLLVFSDGCPFDADTAEVNGRRYLEEHLRAVLQIACRRNVFIGAIGSRAEVQRFYSDSVVLEDELALTERVCDYLGGFLFTGLSKGARS